jgi:hypothetical protein
MLAGAICHTHFTKALRYASFHKFDYATKPTEILSKLGP